MEIELARHDWARLRSFGDSAALPEAIRALARSVDQESALAAYWRIDGVALVDGCLTEAAAAVTPAIVQSLSRISAVALPHALELLTQISGGYVHEPESQGLGPVTLAGCVKDIALAFPLICELLESMDDVQVRSSCIDLIMGCGLYVEDLRERAKYVLSSALNLPNIEPCRRLIENSLAELP